MHEALNAVAYDASRAGLSYHLHEGTSTNAWGGDDNTTFGVGVTSLTLTVDGFRETAPKLTRHILDTMTSCAVSEALYLRVHESLRRKYDNLESAMDPQTHAEWASKELLYAYFASVPDLATAITTWTFSEFQSMARYLFRQCHITALLHGNLSTVTCAICDMGAHSKTTRRPPPRGLMTFRRTSKRRRRPPCRPIS